MFAALLAHLVLLTCAVVRRDGGQSISAGLLFGNWTACSLFVHFSGCDFPWIWYLTIDWLTAITLWIDKETIWQRLLIGSYGIELLVHAAFGWVTRHSDPTYWSRSDFWLYTTQTNYNDVLSVIEWAQTALVSGWIAYDAVRHWRRTDRRISSSVACDREMAS
jgi:hypothetical protein